MGVLKFAACMFSAAVFLATGALFDEAEAQSQSTPRAEETGQASPKNDVLFNKIKAALENMGKSEPQATGPASKVAAIPPCDRAYFFLFNKISNPAYNGTRLLDDAEIGWGFDYEKSKREGTACPPMPDAVVKGILADASADPAGTLAGQASLAKINMRQNAIADYETRARSVVAGAEKCWQDKRAEAMRSSNRSEAMFYGWQSCAQIVTNAEAMSGIPNIVQPLSQDYNAILNFVITSLRNKWAFQDQSIANAQRKGDRGPVWGYQRDAELKRRDDMIYALRNNYKYIRYVSATDLAPKYAPKEVRPNVPYRPSGMPPFVR